MSRGELSSGHGGLDDVQLATGASVRRLMQRPNESQKPRLWRALGRGIRRTCPNCGRGRLFVRWFTLRHDCPVCQLVYLRNPGDTWLFWIVMDRIPIAIGLILIVFFGLRVSGWVTGTLFLSAMVVPLVATMPHRQGVAVALSYLSRVYFRDPSDELPDWQDS